MNDGELAEVLVEGQQDLAMLGSVCQNLLVTGVGRPIGNPFDFVSGCLEVGGCTAPDTRIEKYPHPPEDSVRTGSMRS